MNIKLRFTFIFLVVGFCSKAQQQPEVSWSQCFGGSSADFPQSMIIKTNQEIILAGSTSSNDLDVTGNHGYKDMWIAKTDTGGTLHWQHCLGGSLEEDATHVSLLKDGGFLLSGFTASIDGNVAGNHGADDFWIAKITNNNQLGFKKCFGGTQLDRCLNAIQTSDSCFLMVGFTFSNDGDVSGNHGLSDCWVVKTDIQKNIIWQKCFGGTSIESAFRIVETIDKNYLIIGNTNSTDGDVLNNHGNSDAWILKLDTAGSIIWQKCFGGTDNDYAFDLIQTPDSGFIFTGYSNSSNGDLPFNLGNEDMWVVKIDSGGILAWSKVFGGTNADEGWDVEEMADGYIVTGNTKSNNIDVHQSFGNTDTWVVKLDLTGNILWERNIGGSDFDYGRSSVISNSGDIFVLSMSTSTDSMFLCNKGSFDFVLTKITGDPHVAINNIERENGFRIYPVPANEYFTLQWLHQSNSKINLLNLYDINGRLLLHESMVNGNSTRISTASLNPGVYIAEVLTDFHHAFQKILVKH